LVHPHFTFGLHVCTRFHRIAFGGCTFTHTGLRAHAAVHTFGLVCRFYTGLPCPHTHTAPHLHRFARCTHTHTPHFTHTHTLTHLVWFYAAQFTFTPTPHTHTYTTHLITHTEAHAVTTTHTVPHGCGYVTGGAAWDCLAHTATYLPLHLPVPIYRFTVGLLGLPFGLVSSF